MARLSSVWRSGVTWMLVVALVWTHGRWSALAAQPRRAAPAPDGAMPGAELPSMPRLEPPRELDLVAVRDGAYGIADRYEPSVFFVEDLLQALSFDPEAIFAHVRDRLRFDPYQGILRGAEGVLGAQAGNAYDRSLLLKRLLEDAGVEARLAFGTLSEQHARSLLNHALSAPPAEVDVAPLARLAGFVPPVLTRLEARARRDYEWLRQAVAGAPPDSAGEVAGPASVREHVWVQARLEGQWRDMDSSFPEATIGKAYARAARYALEPNAEEHHRVELILVAEALQGAKLVRHRVLEASLAAADAAENAIYLTFRPRHPGLGGTLGRTLGAQDEFVPVLTVNGESTVGSPLPGVSQDPSPQRAFLGGATGAELTGLYLDVRTVGPGMEPSSSRRTLLDRLPSSVRLAGTASLTDLAAPQRVDGKPALLFAVHQILVSTGGLNPHRVANDVGLAAHFAGTYMAEEAFGDLPLDSRLWPTATLRALWLAVNERLSVARVNGRAGLRFLIGAPRVFVVSQLQYETASGPEIANLVDLLHDELQVVAAADRPPSEVAAGRMRYGAWQSAFETTLLEIGRMALGADGPGLLSASLQTGGEVVTITSASRAPHDAPTALLEQLDAGDSVVLSDASLAEGPRTWWTVSPDGRTRAMLAPTLGGGADYQWWGGYTNTNPFANPRKTYDVSREWRMLNDPKGAAEWERLKQQTLRKAYDRGGGRAADQRVQRAKRVPRTQRSRGGGTEYDIVLETSIWATGYGGIALGLVLLANATVAFMALYVYLTSYRFAGSPP